MAERNPKPGVQNPPKPEPNHSVWNVHDGLHTAPVENITNIDLKAIPPNKPRPIEVTKTSHLFGSFSD